LHGGGAFGKGLFLAHFRMKAKPIPTLALLLAILLAGCSQPITNLTVPQVPQNPSGVYTLTMNARITEPNVDTDSIGGFIVIEGAEHPMTKSPYGELMYEYDYTMPTDRAEAKYYFFLRYNVIENGLTHARVITTPVYTLDIVNRYVLTMEATRGPVGASIPVVGRGIEAQTNYGSPNAVTFAVPPLPADQDYAVELHSGTNVFPIGLFHVDGSNLTITPASVELAAGDSGEIVVGMDLDAPGGGVPVDVETDVPASVIMPEVVIPGGARTVSVKIQGGQPGKGSLHFTAPGFNEVVIPVDIEPAAPPPPPLPPPSPPIQRSMGS
jgi:hypothetical protein